ncbi:MAG TPA: vitamin K epoxide reductase family protein [Dehalococcoidia bacterium]|nr:vitamin K epoxide reductase family protein [Dehalococcoidia bacterium]
MTISGWRIPIALGATGAAGVAISIYLTTVHYAKAPLVCSSSGVVNCERVLSSGYSSVFGVPISLGGIVWFAVLAALGLATLLRTPEPLWLQPAQVAWGFLGLLAVIYLIGVEALALGVLCAWCTALHLLIVTALVLTIVRTPRLPAVEPSPAGARRGPLSRGAAQQGR